MSSVSRETFLTYYELLKEWNSKMNLVQNDTLQDFMVRHVEDSLQLTSYLPDKDASIIDLGSGAGFPGMVLRLAGYKNITLCEANYKKTLFLQQLALKTNFPTIIINKRIEELPKGDYQYVTARALTNLNGLLNWMSNVSRETKQVTGLFLKGEKADEEIKEAEKLWSFLLEKYPSVTHSKGYILKISNLEKRT